MLFSSSLNHFPNNYIEKIEMRLLSISHHYLSYNILIYNWEQNLKLSSKINKWVVDEDTPDFNSFLFIAEKESPTGESRTEKVRE